MSPIESRYSFAQHSMWSVAVLQPITESFGLILSLPATNPWIDNEPLQEPDWLEALVSE